MGKKKGKGGASKAPQTEQTEPVAAATALTMASQLPQAGRLPPTDIAEGATASLLQQIGGDQVQTPPTEGGDRGRGGGRGRGRGRGQPVQQPEQARAARGASLQQQSLPVQQQMPVQQPLPIQQQMPVQQPLPVQQQMPVQQPLPVQQQMPVQQPLPVQQQMPVQQPLPVQQQKQKQKQAPRQQAGSGAKPKETAQAKEEPLSMLPSLVSQLPVLGMKPPLRQNFGKRGSPIKLRVNHFAVKIDPNMKIHHYDVQIRPEMKANKGLKRKIVETVVSSFSAVFDKARCVFDGEKNMYTNNLVDVGRSGKTFEVNLAAKDEKERLFTVEVKKVAEILLRDLQNFLDGLQRDIPQHAIQALDVVFRHLPSSNFITIGRSIFPDERSGYDLGAGVEMWRGYYQSLRPGRWKQLQLNLDVSNRTFYKGQAVLEFAAEFHECRITELSAVRSWDEFAKEMKGIQVQVTHTLNPRKYKIIGLAKPAELLTFPLEQNGTTVQCTVAKFFANTHRRPLQHSRLPCLQAQPADKHRYLPMEVCRIPAGQQTKKISPYQTEQMIRNTAVAAPQRQRDINKLVQSAKLNEDPNVRGFGMSVSDQMMLIDGRILPPPSLNLGSGGVVNPRLGVWDMRQQHFFKSVNIDYWGVINVTRLQDPQVKAFCNALCNTARDTGIMMRPEYFVKRMNARDDRFLTNMFADLKREQPQLKLIVVMLPGKTPLYAEIKRIGDTEQGVITQCVQMKNVDRCNPATLTNILMKINAKLGGVNSILQKTTRSEVFREPVIILGADVTHPAAGETKKPSIAAIVASMDGNAQTYAARVCVQEHRKEVIVDLKAQVRNLLLMFRQRLQCEPKRIIFYRDGVGEGQFQEVLHHELVAIRGACSSLHPNFKPAITFLVVQKRHHTRIFCEDSRQAVGRSQNVPPGTTVDTVITHPIENDFFLCSHQGIQGTSRPTHYHMLWDDNNFTADQLHQLTYELCHTYARCTRSVSIPAPAYYAHLVAFRARYHLEQLQRRMDKGEDTERLFELMQRAVNIHNDTGSMYFV